MRAYTESALMLQRNVKALPKQSSSPQASSGCAWRPGYFGMCRFTGNIVLSPGLPRSVLFRGTDV